MRRGKRRGISEVIGGVILFAMVFAVAFGYFYILAQDQNIYQQASLQAPNAITQENSEHLSIYGFSSGSTLGFYVNNTGIATSIVAYWILNQNNSAIVEYENITTLKRVLPQYISPGASWTFSSTNITISNPNQKYVIKVLTAKGTSAIGTYPSTQLTSAAVNSLVAGGFGSLQMQFSSFTWYDYKSGPVNQVTLSQNGGFCGYGYTCGTCQYSQCNYYFTNLCTKGQQCNGGPWTVDLAHPFQGSRLPEGFESSCNVQGNQWWNQIQNCYLDEVPLVFSVNITNDDPGLAYIVLNSESNLWVVETCDSGIAEGNCVSVGNPVFVFYMMNVNQTTGAIQSANQGSFSEIQIPYGTTKTLFYGSLYDLSLNSYNYVSLTSETNSNPYYYGQFAVFLLFSGTKISQSGAQVYGQNIPFESTTAGDNLGWYSESPTSTSSGALTTFSLQVNNSAFSYNKATIDKVVLNASSFSTLSSVNTPPNWTAHPISKGIINWTSSAAKGIAPNATLTFQWKGYAPTVSGSTQEILPIYIYWSSGVVEELEAAAVCAV